MKVISSPRCCTKFGAWIHQALPRVGRHVIFRINPRVAFRQYLVTPHQEAVSESPVSPFPEKKGLRQSPIKAISLHPL
jgi:hypothetical protein